MKVVIEFESSETSVAATSPDFPNVVAVGKNRDDARSRFLSLLDEWIQWHRERGTPLELPSDDRAIEVVAA